MNTLVIKKEDLIYNIKQIKELIKKAGKDDQGNSIKIIAVVKENLYALGLVEYTKILIDNGISFFAVETIEEGIILRKAGIKQDILMLSPTAVKDDIEILIKNNIIITLGSKDDIEVADKIAKEQKTNIRAYLRIDTGTGLYGFIYNKRDEMIESLKNMKNIKIEGTFSDFVDSNNNDKYTNVQFERFIDVIEVLKMNNIETGILNICDSSAFFKYYNMNLNAIRIGKAFLGEKQITSSIILRKPIILETKISEIKQVPKGFYIGKHKIKKEMRIAIIPYGFEEELKQKYIIINKNKCRILGNIKNNIICEVGEKDITVGEKVVFPVNSSYINVNMRREYR